MKQTLLNFLCIFGMLLLCATKNSMAQKANTPVTVTQQDPRIHVNLFYQKDGNAIGGLTQDYKITVQNKTNDKLHITIEYYADLVCGKRNTHKLGPLGDGYTLKPGEIIDKNWLSDGVASYVRILGNVCPRESWRETGTDKNGSKTYSMINSLGYRIVEIVNISEQERKKDEEKKQKEEEAKKQKQVAATTNNGNNNKTNPPSDRASTGTTQPSANTSNTTSNTTSNNIPQTKSDYKAASQFSGGLNDVKEGDYFKDNNGNYYQKSNGGAQQVEKSVYDKAQIDRMYAQMESQQAEQKERQEVYNQAAAGIAELTTNIMTGIQADRQASWDREYAATSKAQKTIDQMSGLAAEGNEEAMKQINSAYHTLAWYNKEEKSGWTGTYSQTREKFLKETLQSTQSPAAHDLLTGFYEQQKTHALTQKRKSRGRGIGFMLLAGAMGVGGSLAYDAIVEYEDGEFKNEGLGTAALATGIVGGIGFGGWGLVEFVTSFIESGKNSPGYIEADKKQSNLKQQRISWQIFPQYDVKHNASALSFRLRF